MLGIDPNVAALCESSQSQDATVRLSAVINLVKRSGDRDAGTCLLARIADIDAAIRRVAIAGLFGTLGSDPGAIITLDDLLPAEPDPGVRKQIVQTMATMISANTPEDVRVRSILGIKRAAGDPDPAVAATAAQAFIALEGLLPSDPPTFPTPLPFPVPDVPGFPAPGPRRFSTADKILIILGPVALIGGIVLLWRLS